MASMNVLVVGMHRSGTSALAGAIETTGLFVGPPSELMQANVQNPEGFFELQAVADFNDEVLHHLGGGLYEPPLLPQGWVDDPRIEGFVLRARSLIESSFDGRPFILKDPRIALLLPFWRRVLLDRCCAVMIVRDPIEVAWSLSLRDGMSPLMSMALWSGYNRSASEGLSGLPVHVCSYEELVVTPHAVLTSITDSLRDWGALDREVDVEVAASRINTELRRNTWPRERHGLANPPDEVVEFETFLRKRMGRHDAYEAETPPERGFWEGSLLEERRAGTVRLHASFLQNDLFRTQLEETRAQLELLFKEREELASDVHHLKEANDMMKDELGAWCDLVTMNQRSDVEADRSPNLELDDVRRELELIQASRTFRYTNSLRSVYASFRRKAGLL
jgi:hypothetical protein